MLRGMAALQLLLYIMVKGEEAGRYVKSTGGSLRRQEEAKQGDLWGGRKGNVGEHTPLPHRWVRTANDHGSTWRWYAGNAVTTRAPWSCALV